MTATPPDKSVQIYPVLHIRCKIHLAALPHIFPIASTVIPALAGQSCKAPFATGPTVPSSGHFTTTSSEESQHMLKSSKWKGRQEKTESGAGSLLNIRDKFSTDPAILKHGKIKEAHQVQANNKGKK